MIGLLCFWASISLSQAVPLQLTQQGRILDSSGAALSGVHDVTFNVYDDLSAGTLLWTETIATTFSNGYYAAVLGSDTASNPLDSDTLGQYPIYLELQLGSNAPMSPRHAIHSAPYAQMAKTTESLDGGSANATEVSISGYPVIDSGGNWVGQPIIADWNNLTSIPSYITDGDDNTQLTETEVETYVSNDGISLHEDTTLNGEVILTEGSTLEPEWLNIKSRPHGLDDGDDDTQLSSSEVVAHVEASSVNLASGSQVAGQEIVATPSGCTNGQVLLYDLSNASWSCGDDSDSTLTAAEVQAMVESVAGLALQSGATVNGSDILTEASTLDPSNIDASNATAADVLTYDGSTVGWGTVAGGGCSLSDTVIASPVRLIMDCGSNKIVVEGSTLEAASLADSGPYTQGFYCAIMSDSTLTCWGNDSNGQVSDMPSGTFTSVSLGYEHACGLNTSGALECWGNDDYNQVSNTPSGTFTQLAVGQHFGCALDASGQVDCWGEDGYGQSSNEPASTFQSVAVAGDFACGLNTSGGIECWGSNSYNIVSNVPSGTFTQLEVGRAAVCAINSSGSVECWGNASDGGTAPSGTYSSLSKGFYSFCGVETGGAVNCWGADWYGQISELPSGSYTSVSITDASTCAMDSAGAIICWGYDSYSNGYPKTGTFSEIQSTANSVCGIHSSGVVICWGTSSNGQTSPP
ncbi:MAG: RCC1 domain-containing protein [Myxococcota bacterium]|nr:RCC1 domain-containing protein [Myxococcota bacterium]